MARRVPVVLMAAALITLFTIALLSTARRTSLAYDEVIYAPMGVLYWQTGDLRWNNEHPPLQKYISALPLLTQPLSIPPDLSPHLIDVWRAGYRIFFQSGVDPLKLIFLSRLPSAIATLLLAFLVFFWTKSLAGTSAALFSTAVLAFDSLVIANGALAMNDIFLTLFCTASVFFLTRRNWLLCGISVGLAFATKFSAVLLIPALAVLLIKGERPSWRSVFVWAIGFVATVAVVYRFNPMPLKEGFSTFLNIQRDSTNFGFLLIELPSAWHWIYYPAALLIKTPIPLLVLWGLSFAACAKRKISFATASILLSLPLFFGAAALFAGNAWGVRYLLPVVPFLAVLIGVAFSHVERIKDRMVWIGLVGWMAVEAIWVHPHHMAYFNELVGGSRQGHRWLNGSNQDWGQGLPALASFLKKENNPAVFLSYTGSNNPRAWGINYQDVVSPSIASAYQEPFVYPIDIQREYFVVSAQFLSSPDSLNVFPWVEHRKPIALCGYTMFVYDISFDVEAVLQLAEIYRETGRPEMALRQIQRARYLNPEHPLLKTNT